MTIDTDKIADQMAHSRWRQGQFERLVDGEWEPWPVLPMDKLGRKEAERVVGRGRASDA